MIKKLIIFLIQWKVDVSTNSGIFTAMKLKKTNIGNKK